MLGDEQADAVECVMREVLEFEINLARLTLKKSDTEINIVYENKIGQLPSYDGFPNSITDYVVQVLQNLGVSRDRVNQNTKIKVGKFQFLGRAAELIHRTSKEVIINYIGWKVAEASIFLFIFWLHNVISWIAMLQLERLDYAGLFTQTKFWFLYSHGSQDPSKIHPPLHNTETEDHALSSGLIHYMAQLA